ncbi:hypothetical protein [Prochlorococcus marinus]|uniref:hypothetical protein n=1 Tax=Prochlorococcus marinus TaxID=1219 RepID=UPI0022B5766C|nr:hypothetical protein [Prochlorococcus marinus]
MKKVKVQKLLDIRDSVWGFSNLIEKDLQTNLKEVISHTPKEKFFQYSRGLKYALMSNSKKLDDALFKSEPIQRIISIFENQSIVEVIGNLLFESNTDIIQHIEYKNILSDFTNKYDLIQKISNNKYKLLQVKSNKENPWRIMPSFTKKAIEEFILSENSIPYIPSFEFSRIEKGGCIQPHTDLSRKIASIMIYLPKNQEQRDSSLGTTFWKPKNLMGNRVYENNIENSSKQLWDEEYESFKRDSCSPIHTKFQDQFTLIFFRSNTSWHSFEYKQNDIGPRFSLNINFNFPEIAQ